MLAFYSFLAALMWGTLIGGSLRRGYAIDKVQLARAHVMIGSVILTLPVAATLVTAHANPRGLVIAGLTAVVAMAIGIRVGIKTYWIE